MAPQGNDRDPEVAAIIASITPPELSDDFVDQIQARISRQGGADKQPSRLRLLRRSPHSGRLVATIGSRRRLVAAVAAMIVAATASLTVAAVAFDPFQSPPKLVPSEAQQVLVYRTSWGPQVSGWWVPSREGLRCMSFQLEDAGATAFSFREGSSTGLICPTATGQEGGLHAQAIWHALDNGRYGVLVQGGANADSSITRIEVTDAGGPLTSFVSQERLFVGELPPSTAHGEFAPGGPYAVIGYSDSGEVVQRMQLSGADRKR